jgi:hypothetical protein
MKGEYRGSCHCGRIAFVFRGDTSRVFDCNCSMCRRKGALYAGARESDLTIVNGGDAFQRYHFLTKTAVHAFCPNCGVHPFARPRIDPQNWAINVRCLDDVDLSAIDIVPFDGANWDQAARALLTPPGR